MTATKYEMKKGAFLTVIAKKYLRIISLFNYGYIIYH